MSAATIDIFTKVLTLFFAVAAGYLIKRIGIMDKNFDRKLSRLVLDVSLPCLILASTLTAEKLPSMGEMGVTALVACGSYAVTILAALLLTKILHISNGHRGVFRFMMVFGNVGFVGYPVLNAIFGSDSLIYAVIFNLPFNLLVFTVGSGWIAKDNADSEGVAFSVRSLLTPCLIACFLAIILTVLGVHNVGVVGDMFDLMGSITTPLALTIVGSSLADLPVRQLIGGSRLFIASIARLVLMPALIWLAFHQFIDPLLLGIAVVISGMPVAANGTMLCYQHGGDAETMAQGTFITTVLSLFTIPLLMMVFT